MRSKVLIVFLLFVAIGLAVIYSSNFLFGSSNKEKIVEESFSSIDVRSTNMAIFIEPTNEKTTHIRLENNSKRKYHFKVDVKNDILHVNLEEKLFKWFSFNTSVPTIHIAIPEKHYEHVKVKSNNGKIELNDLTIDTLQLKTDNGKINVTSVKSEQIDTKTANGQIAFKDVTGALKAATNTGKILLRTESLDRDIDFKTDVGKIVIETEKEPTNAHIYARTSIGSVKLFDTSNRELTYGDGKYRIDLSSEVGKIIVIK